MNTKLLKEVCWIWAVAALNLAFTRLYLKADTPLSYYYLSGILLCLGWLLRKTLQLFKRASQLLADLNETTDENTNQ